MWAGSDVRRRWRSLIALGLLAGVTAGLALAATHAAQRSASALDRLRAHEQGPDVIVFPSQVGNFAPDWDAVADLPEVEAVLPWALMFGRITEGPEASEVPVPIVFTAVDERFMGAGNPPVVRDGRMWDPEADDEIVLTPDAAEALGVGVGDRIPMELATFEALDLLDAGTPPEQLPDGRPVELEVVGIVTMARDHLFVGDGMGVAPPGFYQRWAAEVAGFQNGDLVVSDGGEGRRQLQADLDEVLAPGTPLLDLDEAARRAETTTGVEQGAFYVFAAVLFGIGMVLVGQAVVRSAVVVGDDGATLRAIGFTRRDVCMVALRSYVPTFTVAAMTTVAAAAVTSAWLPVGTAAELDPDRGIVLDPALTLVFVGTLVVLLAATVVLASWRASDARATGRSRLRPRVVDRWSRRAPLPVALGTSMAFPQRGDRRQDTLGPALVGAAVGVLGVVGVLTIEHGLEDALDHPERAGVAFDATAVPKGDLFTPSGVDATYLDAVREADGVAEVAVMDRLPVDVERVGVPTFTLRADEGHLQPAFDLVVSEGRRPSGPDEVALGPATMSDLGVGVGDTVAVGPDETPMLVVGAALFPHDVHSGFDEGALLDESGWDSAVGGTPLGSDTGAYRAVVVRFDEGVDAEEGIERLYDTVGEQSTFIEPASTPPELTNLQGVAVLPVLLGGFLALLAVGAIAHALTTSVQRRRVDYAVLRSLGMTRRGTRAVLHSEGTIIAAVGLLVGIPLGVVVGRTAWSEVATSVPLEVVRPLAVVLTVLVIPVGLLVVNLLAWWPGHRLQRLHPAEELRSEQ